MNYKKIILFIASCLFILIFFNTTFYSNWFQTKIYKEVESDFEPETFAYQWDHLQPEQRKIDKLAATYTFSEEAAAYMKKTNQKDPLILLPPQEYMKLNGIDMLIPEPIVFYYFCGVKGAWWNSANVNKANWAVVAAENHTMRIVPITTQQERDKIIATFRDAPEQLKQQMSANSLPK